MRLKVYLFFTLSIIYLNKTKAQNITVNYVRQANIEYQLRNETRPEVRERVAKHLASENKTFQLVHCNNISIFREKSKIENQSNPNIMNEGSNSLYYKNINDNLLLRETSLDGSDYLITDTLNNLDWEIISEEKKIIEYNCFKAIAKVEGQVITAWITTELSINDGPAEYFSEKGLILELTLNNFTYKATKITENKDDIEIKELTKGKKISLKEYTKKVSNFKMKITGNPFKN